MSSCIHCALIERPGSCHKHTVNRINRYTKMTPLTGADLAILLRGAVKNFVSLLKDTSRQSKRMKSLISGYAPVHINIFSVTLSSEHTVEVRRSIPSMGHGIDLESDPPRGQGPIYRIESSGIWNPFW